MKKKTKILPLAWIILCVLPLYYFSCSRATSVPPGIQTDELTKDLFVSSRNDNSVKRYDLERGIFLGDFVSPGENDLQATQDIAFGPDGMLYVSGRGNTAIMRYEPSTGKYLGPFTTGYTLDNPTKISFGPDGYLYVSQWGERQSTVARFDAETGAFADEFTGPLNQPLGHAWDKRGNFYVACFGSKEVWKYSGKGQAEGSFAEGGRLSGPTNLWFGADNELYVTDWPTGKVLRFNGRNGKFDAVFIEGLQRVEGFAIGPDGYLYLCDWQTNVINRYDAKTGTFIDAAVTSGDLQQPNGLAFRPK